MAYPSNLDFLNQNQFRAYPLISTGVYDTTSAFSIPDGLIVDASFSVGSTITKRVYISKLILSTPALVIYVSDEADVEIGTFTIDLNYVEINDTVNMAASDAYTGAYGKLTIGDVSSLSTQPSGTFLFTISSGEFEPRTIVPSRVRVDRLVFENADGSSISATGNVILNARTNLRFSEDTDTNTVIFDAGNGLGLNQACSSENQPIETINGISPDVDGDFTLLFDACSQAVPLPNGIRITDICSQSCAGCAEAELLTERLIQMEEDFLALRNRYNTLVEAHSKFQGNINSVCTAP